MTRNLQKDFVDALITAAAESEGSESQQEIDGQSLPARSPVTDLQL